jgi:hypothetical protein
MRFDYELCDTEAACVDDPLVDRLADDQAFSAFNRCDFVPEF